jgi:enamine deaminase RidA (YjgF/YER057c/UK114 family)
VEIKGYSNSQGMVFPTSNPATWKQGDIYEATIKEKINEHEAIMQVRGMEVHVRVDQRIPNEGKIMLEVHHVQDGVVEGRIVAKTSSASLPKPETLELRQAVAALAAKNIPLTEETLAALRTFFQKGTGTIEQKLETIQAAANKRIAIRLPELTAIHEALHGKPIGAVLEDIARQLNLPVSQTVNQDRAPMMREVVSLERMSEHQEQDKVQERGNPEKLLSYIRRQVESALNVRQVQEAVRAAARELPAELGEKVLQALDQALRLETLGLAQSARLRLMQALSSLEKDLAQLIHSFNPTLQTGSTDTGTNSTTSAVSMAALEALSDQVSTEPPMMNDPEEISLLRGLIRRALKAIQREPDIMKALDMAEKEIVPHLQDDYQKQHLMQVLSEAKQLSEKGREMKARQTAVVELEKIKAALPKDAPAIDIDKMMSIQLNTKDIMVQTVTKRMAEATLEFQRAKRDIMRNLNTMNQLIEQYGQSARPQAKQLLESTIKMLDQAILKSDMMMLADMMTEKRLLQASSQLAEAKKFLANGNYEQARKTIQEVNDTLAKLQWKPSDVKVKHFVSQESIKTQDPAQAFWNKWSETIHPEPSARHVLETIRRLGLTYESDVANALVFKNGQQGEAEQTVKEWLMKWAQTEGNPVAKQAEQAAMNITGQQLLNKWDGTSAMQTLFFTIPVFLHNQLKDVKIYVNARNDGKRIDWENCSLYFLLETRKLGDIGILLTANERNLSITLRNDRSDFSEKVSPLLEIAKQNMEEIGYYVQSIQFAPLSETKEEKPIAKETRPILTEKGYDITI